MNTLVHGIVNDPVAHLRQLACLVGSARCMAAIRLAMLSILFVGTHAAANKS